MDPISCVFYESLDPLFRLFLRRFIMEGSCAHDFGDGFQRCCDARVMLCDRVLEKDERGCLPALHHDQGDPRWPKACGACGRDFRPEHCWQVHLEHLYRGPDGNALALSDLPVGAMWYQDFGHGPASRFLLARHVGREGLAALGAELAALSAEDEARQIPHLMVRTPGGVWDMDTIATNGDGWERSSEPPKITASPSIQHTTGIKWHGWLRDGILTEC